MMWNIELSSLLVENMKLCDAYIPLETPPLPLALLIFTEFTEHEEQPPPPLPPLLEHEYLFCVVMMYLFPAL